MSSRQQVNGRLVFVALFAALVSTCVYVLVNESADSDSPARQVGRGQAVALVSIARKVPVKIEPSVKWDDVATRQQTLTALCASLPLWRPPSVPALIHYLKLWGQDANFDMLADQWSGRKIVETLLSDELCRERTVHLGESYLIDSPFGVHVVQLGSEDAGESRGEAHYGQLLKALGQSGVPVDTPLTTASGQSATVEHLLQDAVLRFKWTHELDFIGCALALYLPPQSTWHDQFGNEYSFDDLMEHLLTRTVGSGACGGCHLPYAVVILLRVDEAIRILAMPTRKRALAWLSTVSRLLETTQRPDGNWDKTWSGSSTTGWIFREELMDRITITGHHLEWISLAPESVRPAKSMVSRAVTGLVKDINDMPIKNRSFKTAFPCTHAARALCLLRGDNAFSLFSAAWKSGEVHIRALEVYPRVEQLRKSSTSQSDRYGIEINNVASAGK